VGGTPGSVLLVGRRLPHPDVAPLPPVSAAFARADAILRASLPGGIDPTRKRLVNLLSEGLSGVLFDDPLG
jgi:hypothetical protein